MNKATNGKWKNFTSGIEYGDNKLRRVTKALHRPNSVVFTTLIQTKQCHRREPSGTAEA